MNPENFNSLDIELYELSMPGKLMGKEVIDSLARRIGVVRNIKLNYNPTKILLVIKGIGTEFTVNIENVEAIGTVVKLNIPIRNSEELNIEDVIRIRGEIISELKILGNNIK